MTAHLAERLTRLQDYFTEDPQPELSGRLTRMVGLTLECVGCPMVVGDRCVITGQGAGTVEAEVVGFEDDRVYLMPLTAIEGLRPGSRVVPLSVAGSELYRARLSGYSAHEAYAACAYIRECITIAP